MKKCMIATNLLIIFMVLIYIIVAVFFDIETYVENFGLCGVDVCDNGLAFYRNLTSLFMFKSVHPLEFLV